MIQLIEFVAQLMGIANVIGLLIGLILLVFLSRQDNVSSAAQTYAAGSLAAILLGGSVIIGETSIMWGNVIGLVGGYVLIVLALAQYWFDRQKKED
jgi:hypothetical protein